MFALLGPNGAGKTTTVEILEGYRKRDGGDVQVLGTDPGGASRAFRSRIGIVLQSSAVYPTLSVDETLRLFAGYTRPRDSTRWSGWSASRRSASRASGRSPAASSAGSTSGSRSSATPSSSFSTSRRPASTRLPAGAPGRRSAGSALWQDDPPDHALPRGGARARPAVAILSDGVIVADRLSPPRLVADLGTVEIRYRENGA